MKNFFNMFSMGALSLWVSFGCASESNTTNTAKTAIRIAHLHADGSDARLCLYDASGIRGPIPSDGTGVVYGSVGPYSTEQVQPNTAYTAKLFPASITSCPSETQEDNLIGKMSISGGLLNNAKYTLVLWPTKTLNAGNELSLVRDDEVVDNSKAKIRITNALLEGTNPGPVVSVCYDDALFGSNATVIFENVKFKDVTAYSLQGGPGATATNAYFVNSMDAQKCGGAKIVESGALAGGGLPVSALINVWAVGDVQATADSKKPKMFVSVDSFE